MVEIERKFLVKNDNWKPADKANKIKQGYLSVDPERVVRVRISDEKAYLTIKGKLVGIVRTEMEYEIPKDEAEILLKLCLNSAIEKTRYTKLINNLTWEIDVFEGVNDGLVMAEIELEDANQKIDMPDWAGEEVSTDKRYFNSWLSQHPFSSW